MTQAKENSSAQNNIATNDSLSDLIKNVIEYEKNLYPHGKWYHTPEHFNTNLIKKNNSYILSNVENNKVTQSDNPHPFYAAGFGNVGNMISEQKNGDAGYFIASFNITLRDEELKQPALFNKMFLKEQDSILKTHRALTNKGFFKEEYPLINNKNDTIRIEEGVIKFNFNVMLFDPSNVTLSDPKKQKNVKEKDIKAALKKLEESKAALTKLKDFKQPEESQKSETLRPNIEPQTLKSLKNKVRIETKSYKNELIESIDKEITSCHNYIHKIQATQAKIAKITSLIEEETERTNRKDKILSSISEKEKDIDETSSLMTKAQNLIIAINSQLVEQSKKISKQDAAVAKPVALYSSHLVALGQLSAKKNDLYEKLESLYAQKNDLDKEIALLDAASYDQYLEDEAKKKAYEQYKAKTKANAEMATEMIENQTGRVKNLEIIKDAVEKDLLSTEFYKLTAPISTENENFYKQIIENAGSKSSKASQLKSPYAKICISYSEDNNNQKLLNFFVNDLTLPIFTTIAEDTKLTSQDSWANSNLKVGPKAEPMEDALYKLFLDSLKGEPMGDALYKLSLDSFKAEPLKEDLDKSLLEADYENLYTPSTTIIEDLKESLNDGAVVMIEMMGLK